MTPLLDPILVVVLLLNLFALGNSRIPSVIRIVGFQGALLGVLPLQHAGIHAILLSLATILLKGIVIPWMLLRAMRAAQIRREMEPMIGYLMLENGIFIFGMLLVEAMPFMVEIGILLDLFVGIFVISIIVHHINVAFSSLDTRKLSSLKE